MGKAHSMGKPRGLYTARKQVTNRRDNRWSDAHFKKRALGNFYKTSPTGGSSQAKGIVLEKIGVEAKQPNSAIRKCVRVQLIKNGKKVSAFVPFDGCLNFVDENDEVLIEGFGRKGKAKGDIPGVRFKVVKVSGVGLSALWKEKKENPRSYRSRLFSESNRWVLRNTGQHWERGGVTLLRFANAWLVKCLIRMDGQASI